MSSLTSSCTLDIVSADEPTLPRDAKEVEAELGAYLVKSVLGQTQNLDVASDLIPPRRRIESAGVHAG